MRIELKTLLIIIVPVFIALLTAHFGVMGWLAISAQDARAERAELKAIVGSAIKRMDENSDDIDEIRKHKHTGTTVAMYDRYEDE